MDLIQWLWPVALGMVGLLFGSFANVVIWRVPQGESIVAPGSHCPRCGQPVRWHDNIPVVSWLLLRGRCRDCDAPISPRYPLVEAASGLLFAVAGWRWGFTPLAVAGAVLFWFLLVLSAIDIDTGRLPNPIVLALGVTGAVGVVASQVARMPLAPLVSASGYGLSNGPVAMALIGSLTAGGISAAIAWLYKRARGVTGLGTGDVKLLLALGMFLGPYALLAYALANIIGVVGGVVVARVRRVSLTEAKVPFGPFLSASAIVIALWGPVMWGAYLRLAGAA